MAIENDHSQYFVKEQAFEDALVALLPKHGWEPTPLIQPSEDDLVKNWAKIIYDNNRDKGRLNNFPLTDTEMAQIITQVNQLDSPYAINQFINGKYVCIKRDNPADTNNCGNEVYLKIFDPDEISAGQSRYQIARQPRFKAAHSHGGDRRGDVMLLINGMPVIHIELKRSKVDVSQAVFQIKRYTHEGVFSQGIFKMVQIFVAMNPDETIYFANPGTEDNFKEEYQFHWADFNNTVINDWRRIVSDLLSIPMAHQMIGYYTIADEKDKALKVLRSYQYYAASKICDVAHKANWDIHQKRGGYVWHTTGSGKTLTSFKSAQLIAASKDADKVVFLMDRIELSIQSLDEFRGFAGEKDDIQDTQNTADLIAKLLSEDRDDRLIVTSIQKMSKINIKNGINQGIIDKIGHKRLIFIIDECHRSVFGQMLIDIKNTFPRSLLFGFTGTPVFPENAKKEITTATIFGDMLHKYTIANGIPDKNVLGFDLTRVCTYDENELREKAAFAQLEVSSIEDIENDEEKMAVYNHFVHELAMPDTYNDPLTGELIHGIEHYLPMGLYKQEIHHQAVAKDIVDSRATLSKNRKFHAILATKSIPEAIAYYELFKRDYPDFNVVAVFDNNIDNSDDGIAREDAINEMLDDYNKKYGQSFTLPTYAKYKKDVAKRLAHKKPYTDIEHDHGQQIDLLIVVTQMLTGYDSKWVNTLYVDKLMKYVDIIQAFSRTNRLFGPDKPFGIIRYYTMPYTMGQNIDDALNTYVDRPLIAFVDNLEVNLISINKLYHHIEEIFVSHGIPDFGSLPEAREARNMFAKDFLQMTRLIESAKFQGFSWEKKEYVFPHNGGATKASLDFDETTYLILLQRYRDLFDREAGPAPSEDFEYPIDTFITETGAGTIDAEYINSKFEKFLKKLYTTGPGSDITRAALEELHRRFPSLSPRDRRTATVIIHDIQSGDLKPEAGKSLYDYITQYQLRELHLQIKIMAEATGVNASQLQQIMNRNVTEETLNEFGQFESLKATIDAAKAAEFLLKVDKQAPPKHKIKLRMDKKLRDFILNGLLREEMLKAYLNQDETPAEEIVEEIPGTFNLATVKERIEPLLRKSLAGLLSGMRDMAEILNSVMYVMQAKSIDSLDSVGMYIERAFANLYCKESTRVDKFVAFNLLVTKFEAYLKKLYYLIHKSQIQPNKPGEDVTWSNVIHAHKELWDLKYKTNPDKKALYQNLLKVKEMRNEESHISPTATDQEIENAINMIVTLYFYITGKSITDLESAGHDLNATLTNNPYEELENTLHDILRKNAYIDWSTPEKALKAVTPIVKRAIKRNGIAEGEREVLAEQIIAKALAWSKEENWATAPIHFEKPTIQFRAYEPLAYKLVADVEFKYGEKYLIGCYNGQEHLEWIARTGRYNVRAQESDVKQSIKRDGTVENIYVAEKATKLLLYNVDNPAEYWSFELMPQVEFATSEDMKALDYPRAIKGHDYFLYGIKAQLQEPQIDVQSLIENYKPENYITGAPLFIPINAL